MTRPRHDVPAGNLPMYLPRSFVSAIYYMKAAGLVIDEQEM
jgi:hypothetical protein